MAETPISPAPGICFSESYYSLGKNTSYVTEGAAFRQGSNRWSNGYNCEFYAGYPQKIAGWSQASPTVMTGIPRCCIVWRDNTGSARVGIGTETHLYNMLGSTITDITPLRTQVSSTLTNPLSTVGNSGIVTVADTGATLAIGDWVFLSSSVAIGGITLDGWYNVEAVNPGTSYAVTTPFSSSGSHSSGGGTVTYQYPRVTLSGPFTTIITSAVVKVTQSGHGTAIGDFVVFSGATAVGGLTIDGEYQVSNVIDANNYDITAASAATSSASGGGGSAVSVIYPVPLQQIVSAAAIGYGTGAYGLGVYQGSGAQTTPATNNGWTLSAYGNQLLACPIGGTIYVFDPAIGGRAYPLLNAPLTILAMFVTPERFVFALGINGNPMELAFCDQNDYTDWTTTPTNTAETGRTMIGGSFLVGGVAVRPGVSLFWSDRCVFVATYTGSQSVYSTLQSGDNCGLVSPTAMTVEGGIAYWFSDRDFWAWNGTTTPLPSDDVREYVFGPDTDAILNQSSAVKCTVTLNRAKKQVRFYYPAGSATENNVGMIYHYDQQCWAPLAFGRSCATDANLLSQPVSCDTTSVIYFDETGVDANGVALPWLLELGATDISNGDRNVDIMGFTPDFLYLTGSPQLEIQTQYYPDQAQTVDGPYTITSTTNRQDLRSDGKLFGFSLQDAELGCNFRLGLPRVDIQPAGARR